MAINVCGVGKAEKERERYTHNNAIICINMNEGHFTLIHSHKLICEFGTSLRSMAMGQVLEMRTIIRATHVTNYPCVHSKIKKDSVHFELLELYIFAPIMKFKTPIF